MWSIWFKFEDKIQNISKVIVFTRKYTDDNEADDDDANKDDRTKNNVSHPVGGGYIIEMVQCLTGKIKILEV